MNLSSYNRPDPGARAIGGSPRRGNETGMTILELMVAMGIFAMVLLLIMASVIVTEEVRRFAGEKDTAREAMENELARLQSLGFQGVIDEVAASGVGMNLPFTVLGLDRGMVPSGQVSVVLDETVADADLGIEFGMPRDLDGDGLVDNIDTSATATLIPMVASVTWTGVAGTQTLRTVIVMHRPKAN